MPYCPHLLFYDFLLITTIFQSSAQKSAKDKIKPKKENTFALGTLEILETNKAHICKYMCLAFKQSEHMKELLFTIHPVFFNLTTPEVVKGQRRRVSQQGGGVGRRRWSDRAGKGSVGSAVASYGLSLAG